MNATTTLRVGVDVHLDEIVLRAVDKADGHEVVQRFHVTNNWQGAQSAVATIAQTATQGGYTTSRSVGKRPACCGYLSIGC